VETAPGQPKKDLFTFCRSSFWLSDFPMKNRPARTLGYTAAFFAAFVIFPDITRAQVAPAAPATETVKLEAFTVTGSNIRRIDQESTLPVSVIDFDDIDVRAAPTAAELLQLLPNGGVLSLSETNVLGADARGDNTSLNLRGIGSGNTLVLVNGRRLAPHPISQAEGGVPSLAVNVNQLPVAAIKRVEVLRDGASAIYGADAAAGVVNTILRRDYDGYDVSLRGGQPEGVWLKHATRTTPHADCDRCMFQPDPIRPRRHPPTPRR